MIFMRPPPQSVKDILTVYPLCGSKILEPCVGSGNIAKVIDEFYVNKKDITAVDIVDRGYPGTIVTNFLSYYPKEKFDCIVTNPPFSLAEDFIYHSMELLNGGYDEDGNPRGQLLMFLKIQFLESVNRKALFEKYPPKYVYVFRKRQNTWRNGDRINQITGKEWAGTMCFAWFVWEKGSTSEPIIRWID